MHCFHVEIASAEDHLYSGKATKLFVVGVNGELEVLYGHAPLLTILAPGPIWVEKENGKKEGLVIFGGVLEVQRTMSIILADIALRAKDLDQAKAMQAKQRAESALAQQASNVNYAKARAELAFALAQLKVIRSLKQ